MKKKLFFAAICLVMFAANFANSVQGILLTDYIEYYGLESATQGMISSFQSIGCIASCFLIMFLAGGLKRSRILAGSAAALFLSMALLGTRPPFVVLLLLYAVLGVGYAAASNVSSSFASELYTGSSAAMGLVHVCFGLGGLLGPLVLQRVRAALSWQFVCMVDAAVLGLVLILYLVSLRVSRPVLAELQGRGQRIRLADIGRFLKKRRNLLLLLGTFGYMAFQNGVNVWIARFFTLQMDSAQLGAIALSTFWIGNAVARLTVMRLKIRTEVLFGIGCLITAAAFGAGIALQNPGMMIACIVICGLTSGACIPQIYHMGCTWNDGNSLLPTSVLGLMMWVSCIVTAPLTASLTQYGMIAAMCSVAAYALIGGAAMLPLLRRRGK